MSKELTQRRIGEWLRKKGSKTKGLKYVEKKGADPDFVEKCTGLTEKILEELRRNLKSVFLLI